MRALIVTLTSTAALLGCGTLNLNHSVNLDSYRADRRAPEIKEIPATDGFDQSFAGSSETTQRPISPPQKTTAPVVCPLYKSPKLPPVPPLPYKELLALGPGQPARVDELERKHIEDLRAYATNVRAAQARAQSTYLRECREYQRTQGR